MSVVVYAPDGDASAFYRLTEPARVTYTRVVERLPEVGDASTVVLNRPLDPGIAEQIRLWREEGRRVVVDMDDCFDTVSANHVIHGRYTTEHMHSACKAASLVTCSTPALAERYGYGHAVVLRNRIPEARLSVVPDGNREPVPWIGWYGSMASHPDDPAVTGGGVGSAMLGTGAEFTFIGPKDEAPKLASVLGVEQVNALGFYSMRTLPRVVAEFDIGIVPLEPSPFNEAKSALKGLEMAALGVPVIASPTSEYKRMAGDGACLIAATPGAWEGLTRLLLTSRTARRRQAERGYEWAMTQTYERHADDWRTAWYSDQND
jgi:hypothetical protein